MKDQAQLTALLNKYLANQCSFEEVEELMQYFNSAHSGVLEEMVSKQFEALEYQQHTDPALPSRVFEAIKAKIEEKQPTAIRKKLLPKWAAAASVAIALLAGSYFYYNSQIVNRKSTIVNNFDIAPGKNGATLTLANGRKILINDALTGNIADEAGVTISKTTNGQISYVISSEQSDENPEGLSEAKSQTTRTSFNTLTTAKGETYQVRLPDGSLVYLNAESSLTYPTTFAKNREVTLVGEAYFEVASKLKDSSGKQKEEKVPFIVVTNSLPLGGDAVGRGGQKVEVLGTHFNINGYTNEPNIKTTLLEGSVRVSSLRGTKQSQTLAPREQSTLSPSGAITLANVNTEDIVAWTKGKFVFEQEEITSVMRKLARWYNVEVVYQGNFEGKTFTGTISRYDNISKILDKITFTEALRFKIEGRRVTIMP